jgi:hypothetical protein
MESIFGGLIEFDNHKEFADYIENMDKEKALQIIEKQIEYFVLQGGFSLTENHVLYKCLNKLKNDANKNQGNHLHNDDINGNIS